MPKNEALGLELRQIIQTDQTAGDIIDAAKAKRREIEKETEREKAAILADAQKRRETMEQQVKREQAEQLENSKAAAQREFEQSRARVQSAYDTHREEWKAAILARITGAQ